MLAGSSPFLSLLLLFPFPALGAAPLPATPAQGDREEQLARAQKRFDAAVEERDRAYRNLLEVYRACEAWLTAEATPTTPPPRPIARWMKEAGLTPDQFQAAREQLHDGSFAEIWNQRLYVYSKAAKEYAERTRRLERAFHVREKRIHPERFARGSDRVPPGMALIPGGNYVLGPATGYLLGFPDRARERKTRLRPFYLDKREVSCAEYAQFLLAQPEGLRDQHLPAGWGWSPDGEPVFPDGSAALPVGGISWVSAAAYAKWAGKRLPTEDEWEAAAAGFDRRRYPLGDHFDAAKVNVQSHGAGAPLSDAALNEDNTPQGVLCMSGNLREWTADLYEQPQNRDHAVPAREVGPTTQAVVRGGSFRDATEACQSTYRWIFPALDTRLPWIGFRCAADVR